MRGEALDWLYEASEDLETARSLFKLRRYAHACFHAQQAAEKALKAAILVLLRRLERQHDLVELYTMVKEGFHLPREVEELMVELSSYYTQARYPNAGLRRPSKAIGSTQAEKALKVAEAVVDEAKRVIGEA